MLKFGIKNYEDFKELFVREDGKRKNRIILDMWKDREFMRYISSKKYRAELLGCTNMGSLFSLCDSLVQATSKGNYDIRILGGRYRNDKYQHDSDGICVDGDFRSYRYRNMERDGKVFKMRIGKLYKQLIDSSEFGKHLPVSVQLFLCEEIAQKWAAYSASRCPEYELHIDDSFEEIYSSDYCEGSFGSCMMDGDNYHFYEDCVDAKAAYLTNSDGLIISRCVIYTDVRDDEGNKYRLAERQYSSEGDEVLKHMLVHALVKGGHIDGYKKVGAGCHSPELWLDVNGSPMPNVKFNIRCDIDYSSYISYQDSFKWCNKKKSRAYNYEAEGSYEVLSTTEAHLQGNWDSWHEEYTDDDLCTVYYHGDRYTCAEGLVDDNFVWVEGREEYHHCDDVLCCPECDEYYLEGDGYYSEITEEYYCCEDCKDEAEKAAKSEEDE